ncbi:hypothetical protein FK220_012735 [Flavobacteriaceae bacterium TP-CH-4]|uniref:Secreted protein n=1 Tax=Pelagihabitans pacificus TaxID=2696054 RepID=A0A967EEB6_9FLAO|nr:hypothetical protein [Pelagihabitans pacificus]NHF60213.1 hypothetical protein [Pelagihabitans pacificus]
MKSKSFYLRISFLLLILLAVKVSSFHVYAHEVYDETVIEHCSICDIAVENQHPPLSPSLDYWYDFVEIPSATTIQFDYQALTYQRLQRASLFGRPPPC